MAPERKTIYIMPETVSLMNVFKFHETMNKKKGNGHPVSTALSPAAVVPSVFLKMFASLHTNVMPDV